MLPAAYAETGSPVPTGPAGGVRSWRHRLFVFVVQEGSGVIATELRVNDRIRVPKVRVVGADGSQIGIIDTQEALDMAADAGPRSRRGGRPGRSARLPDHGLRQVQVRAGPTAEGSSQEAVADRRQRDEDAAEDRPARLRNEEGSRRSVPAPGCEGEGHDHVPGPRDGSPGPGPASCSTGSPTTSQRSRRSIRPRRSTAAT